MRRSRVHGIFLVLSTSSHPPTAHLTSESNVAPCWLSLSLTDDRLRLQYNTKYINFIKVDSASPLRLRRLGQHAVWSDPQSPNPEVTQRPTRRLFECMKQERHLLRTLHRGQDSIPSSTRLIRILPVCAYGVSL